MDHFPERMDRAEYDRALMVKAAWYYYVEDYTQQKISDLLGVSRSKVVSLLETARQTGVIQFSICQSDGGRMQTERALMSRFGLHDAFVIPGVSTLPSPNESIAQAAAMYILRRAEPNTFINMGYGDTTSRILNHLATGAQAPLNLVSLSGGVNYYLPDIHLGGYNARLHLVPAPLLVSSKSVREALLQEPDLVEISRMIPLSSMTVVGIGAMDDDATILTNGILTKNDFTLLKMQGAVGDLLSHFMDKNGRLIDVDLEDRLLSLSLDKLRQLDNVIGVAGGLGKTDAILAALRGRYLDVLITDEDTALRLLKESAEG